MNHALHLLWLLFVTSLCKETAVKDKSDKSNSKSDDSHGYSIADELNMEQNQCCSNNNPYCCVSLTWSDSISREEHVPTEFGGKYFCENFNIIVSQGCNDLDYIYLPVSTSCDFTRVLWSLACNSPDIDSSNKDCNGFKRAQMLVDGEIVLNNADDFIVSPSDDNPTGSHALKVPIVDHDGDKDVSTISICTQLEWGRVIQKIDDEDIRIGYSVDNEEFSCSNASIRDICSIDASLAVDKAQSIALNVMNLRAHHKKADGVQLYGWLDAFEFYWYQYVGIGMAVFAASVFFNIVMCIYWSAYRKSDDGDDDGCRDTISKVIDTDDLTETESDDSDDDEMNQEDPLFV